MKMDSINSFLEMTKQMTEVANRVLQERQATPAPEPSKRREKCPQNDAPLVCCDEASARDAVC